MTLRGDLAELMVKTSPEIYQKYVVIEKRRILLYVLLLKSLYRCLCSVLILYKELLTDIKSIFLRSIPTIYVS